VRRLRAASTGPGRVTAALALWGVAAGSKLVVLELIDLVFGDAVSLGGFVPVTVLVVVLLLARGAVRRLLDDTPRPGDLPDRRDGAAVASAAASRRRT
jgi:hypothetical protein